MITPIAKSAPHKGSIVGNNKVTHRPIVRIVLDMRALADLDAKSTVRKLSAAVGFLKDEHLLGV
jgi:hypothetical protein